MSIELSKEIQKSIKEAEVSGNLSKDTASRIWRNIASIYRLRLHEGYLIEITDVVLNLASIVEDKYPVFGQHLRVTLEELMESEDQQRELFSTVYSQMGIDHTEPATEAEIALINKLQEFNSTGEMPEKVRQKALEFLSS